MSIRPPSTFSPITVTVTQFGQTSFPGCLNREGTFRRLRLIGSPFVTLRYRGARVRRIAMSQFLLGSKHIVALA